MFSEVIVLVFYWNICEDFWYALKTLTDTALKLFKDFCGMVLTTRIRCRYDEREGEKEWRWERIHIL